MTNDKEGKPYPKVDHPVCKLNPDEEKYVESMKRDA